MTKKKYKILICDDEKAIRAALEAILAPEGYEIIITVSGAEAVESYKKEYPDLIILDVSMPGMSGLEVLDRVKPYFGDKYVPVIFLTASIKIDDKLKALHSGAVDYLLKPVSPEELIARIQNFIEIKEKHDTLKEEATFDWMTGALNKAYFLRKANEEIAKSLRNKIPLTFILTDIDRFKKVNDTLGHMAGDRAIRELASRLKKLTRKIDLIGRFGGDEFMLMLSHKNAREAKVVAERLKKEMRKPVIFEGKKIQLTLSIGVIEIGSSDIKDAEGALALADKALYEAKSEGGDRYIVK